MTGCYSGGHTILDATTGAVVYVAGTANVTATAEDGVAGGLIGKAGSATIADSYSTCSVSGATAGGFAGTAAGNMDNCYATGQVNMTVDADTGKVVPVSDRTSGAFAGTYDASGTATDCLYYEIVGEYFDADTGAYAYLPAIAAGEKSGISALDASAEVYNTFTGGQDAWKDATPYNETLAEYYSSKYNLQTVAQLWTSGNVQETAGTDEESGLPYPADFVAAHYGDWPAPEIFLLNSKQS